MATTTPQQIAGPISEKSHNAATPPLHKRTYQACVWPTLSKPPTLANVALRRFLVGEERSDVTSDLSMNLMTLHVSDVAAKLRNATSPPPEENERQIVRMGNLRERCHRMRSMRPTFPEERDLELLALLLASHCHMNHIR